MVRGKVIKEDFEDKDAQLHTTPGAFLSINQLMGIRKNNETPLPRKPHESTKLINEKIESLICSDDEIKNFMRTVEHLKKTKD